MQQPQTSQLATLTHRIRFEDISAARIDQLKRHLLDTVGSMIRALYQETPGKLRRQIKAIGEGGQLDVVSLGPCPLDRAAQFYTALVRYPDFMDNFLGKEATCHPSDNLGALLALGQAGYGTGRDLLTALAIGYAIECRLTEELPVMMKGFDHTVLLAFSLTAAISRMLGLDPQQTAHALAMAGCSINPLVTSRASYTSEWKGLASSFVAQNCMQMALLAKEGMTGPLGLFEGPKGYKEIYGMTLEYDWTREDLSLIDRCSLKAFNSEVHTQSALEAIRELMAEHRLDVGEIEKIDITTFLTCYHIVGGGAYGDRKTVHSKEQADHSLPYLAAVLLLDGEVYPEQLTPSRIGANDVQTLLSKVQVHTKSPIHKPLVVAGLLDPYTQAYPEKLACEVSLVFRDGKRLSKHKEDYHGYYTRPFTWEDTAGKFRKLTGAYLSGEQQERIIDICGDMENRDTRQLMTVMQEGYIAMAAKTPDKH